MVEIQAMRNDPGVFDPAMDQCVIGYAGRDERDGVTVESVCHDAIEAMMEAYHREGNTYRSKTKGTKCRCGCSG